MNWGKKSGAMESGKKKLMASTNSQKRFPGKNGVKTILRQPVGMQNEDWGEVKKRWGKEGPPVAKSKKRLGHQGLWKKGVDVEVERSSTRSSPWTGWGGKENYTTFSWNVDIIMFHFGPCFTVQVS